MKTTDRTPCNQRNQQGLGPDVDASHKTDRARLARRQGGAPADRCADAVCAQRPHPQRGAGGSDRRLHPRVGLDQPGAGHRRGHDHRRPRPGPRRPEARPGRSARHGGDWLDQGADPGLRARRQQARPQCRLGRGAAWRWRSPSCRTSASRSTYSASTTTRLVGAAAPLANGPDRSRRGARASGRSRCRGPATSGCSAGIACCAATAPWLPTSRRSWAT